MTQIGLEYLKHKDNLKVAQQNAESQSIQAKAATSQARSSALQAEVASMRQAEDARHNSATEEQQRVMTIVDNLIKTSPRAAITVMASLMQSEDVPTEMRFIHEDGTPWTDEEMNEAVEAMYKDFEEYIAILNAGSILRGIGSITK